MNWFEFIAAVAWPVTVIFFMLLFYRPIVELIRALKRLKIPSLGNAEFGERLLKCQEPTKLLGDEKLEAPNVKLLNRPEYYRGLLSVSPRRALLEAWVEIKTAAEEASNRHEGPGERVFHEPNAEFEFLCSKGIISKDDYVRIQNLRELRNMVADEPDISGIRSQLIETYIASALELAIKLQGV